MKLYISRRDLRELGFVQEDRLFNGFHEGVNSRVAKDIEEELKVEIMVNHGEDMLKRYLGLLEEKGFDSPVLQDWLEENVPALAEIETERREIVLGRLRMERQ